MQTNKSDWSKILDNWKAVYHNKNINSTYLSEIKSNQLLMENFKKPPIATILGIKLQNGSQFGYQYFNYYSALYLIKSYYKNVLKKQIEKKIVLYFDKQINSLIIKDIISYLTLKKFMVFMFENREFSSIAAENLLLQQKLNETEFSYIMFLYNKIDNCYYLQTFSQGEITSIESKNKIINYYLTDEEFLELGPDEKINTLDFKKVENIIEQTNLKIKFFEDFKNTKFSVSIVLEDIRNYKLISKILVKSKINFKISTNISIFKYLSRKNKISALKQTSLFKKFSSDCIFLLSKQNELIVFIYYKGYYIKLSSSEVAFLFIDYKIFKIKTNEPKTSKILIPINCPNYVMKKIKSYELNLIQIDDFNCYSDIVFGYFFNWYWIKKENKVALNSIEMLFLLLKMFNYYKQNNTLLNFKFQKLKSDLSNYIEKKSTFQIQKKDLEHLKQNYFVEGEEIYKNFKITSINYFDFVFLNHNFLQKIVIKSKKIELVSYLIYNNQSNTLTIENQFTFLSNKWFLKFKIFFINRSIVKLIHNLKK
ncbi:MAG5620 family putative phospho-sugar mutase [Mycoplasmopsis cricetuli]|uniref:MAG5620 family putative phospho-sugar mutase n=1 Tax=Mycoplasmopsis cricetuli TaxID=171283 RepID=UPI000472AB97|nr:hypothetical protein [Mycoplasmopsis cricetuli]